MATCDQKLGEGTYIKRTNLKRGHTYKQTNEPWGGRYLLMNEFVFVDTKHQSLECNFISIEDWNYLLIHDLLKCYKFFLWQDIFICNKILSCHRNFLLWKEFYELTAVFVMIYFFQWQEFFPLTDMFYDSNLSLAGILPVTQFFSLTRIFPVTGTFPSDRKFSCNLNCFSCIMFPVIRNIQEKSFPITGNDFLLQ